MFLYRLYFIFLLFTKLCLPLRWLYLQTKGNICQWNWKWTWNFNFKKFSLLQYFFFHLLVALILLSPNPMSVCLNLSLLCLCRGSKTTTLWCHCTRTWKWGRSCPTVSVASGRIVGEKTISSSTACSPTFPKATEAAPRQRQDVQRLTKIDWSYFADHQLLIHS